MPDTSAVLTAFRDELRLADLVRRPGDAGPLPPAFVEPEGGAPAPGDREGNEGLGDVAVTLRLGSEAPEDPESRYRRRVTIDVIYRSRKTAGLKKARALDAAIRAAIVDRPDLGLGFMLGGGLGVGIFVLDTATFAGLSPVSEDAGVRTDRASYLIETYAA